MGSGLMAYTPKRCCTTALLALVGGMACAAGLEPVSAPVSAAMAWATGAQAWLAAMLLGVALALVCYLWCSAISRAASSWPG